MLQVGTTGPFSLRVALLEITVTAHFPCTATTSRSASGPQAGLGLVGCDTIYGSLAAPNMCWGNWWEGAVTDMWAVSAVLGGQAKQSHVQPHDSSWTPKPAGDPWGSRSLLVELNLPSL